MAFAAMLCLTGCFPVLAHPTRVERGLRLSSFTSVSLVSDSAPDPERATFTLLPAVDFEVSIGTRDSLRDDGPGLRLAASGGMSGYGGSVYLELPRDQWGTIDTGIGIAGHRGIASLWTPYFQFGRYESDDMSWFVRNGVAFAAASDSASWAVLWIPTVSIVRHRTYRDAAVFLSTIVGNQERTRRPCFFDCPSSYLRTRVMLGVSVNFTLMTPYRPDRR